MRALSIRQPEASLIALGYSRYHTRTWSTGYRGGVLIHASARNDQGDYDLWRNPDVNRYLTARGYARFEDLPRGRYIAHATLIAALAVATLFSRQSRSCFVSPSRSRGRGPGAVRGSGQSSGRPRFLRNTLSRHNRSQAYEPRR